MTMRLAYVGHDVRTVYALVLFVSSVYSVQEVVQAIHSAKSTTIEVCKSMARLPPTAASVFCAWTGMTGKPAGDCEYITKQDESAVERLAWAQSNIERFRQAMENRRERQNSKGRSLPPTQSDGGQASQAMHNFYSRYSVFAVLACDTRVWLVNGLLFSP